MLPQATELDPLLCDIDLPLRAVYHPLGFSVEIVTNSHDFLAAAQESWGGFRRTFPEPALQMRIGVSQGASEECPPAPVCRAWRHLLARIADRENFSVTDLRNGIAFGWLTEGAVRNRTYLRYYFAEAIVWDLLTPRYLTPIHGACVSLRDRGVLLCGESGAGKSSLAYACARSGWTFLSDDSCCLVHTRRSRTVVGDPHRMRFRQSAVDLFPELGDHDLTLRVNGELAIELPTANLRGVRTTTECAIDFIVFLNREPGKPPGLWPVSRDRARQWFEQVICFGEEEARAAQRVSLRDLLSVEVFELCYDDLGSALRQLEALVRENLVLPSQPCAVARDPQNA